MNTEIMTKQVFLQMIDKGMKDNEVIIFSNRLEKIKVLSIKKKTYAKGYSVVYPKNIFKNEESINDLISSKLLGIIICDNKILNEKLQKQFKEVKKK